MQIVLFDVIFLNSNRYRIDVVVKIRYFIFKIDESTPFLDQAAFSNNPVSHYVCFHIPVADSNFDPIH